MLCLRGSHAQLGSDLPGCAPSLRLLFYLSFSSSSLSLISGTSGYEAHVLSWPKVAQLATAQEWAVMVGCYSVATQAL